MNKEFNDCRGLNPVKIFVTGPPASGKTFYSEKVAAYYNIPRIHVKELVDEVIAIADQDEDKIDEEHPEAEFFAKVRNDIGELRTDEAEKQSAIANANKPEDDDEIELDPKDMKVKVPNKFLYNILQKRLKENDARNRGYVLDGFPRTHEDAQNCFLKKPIVRDEDGVIQDDEEDEDEKIDFSKWLKIDDIIPSSSIVIDGNDKALTDRIMELT